MKLLDISEKILSNSNSPMSAKMIFSKAVDNNYIEYTPKDSKKIIQSIAASITNDIKNKGEGSRFFKSTKKSPYLYGLINKSSDINTTLIKSFKIRQLFGHANIELKFEKNTLILVGENGFGKTTILKCFIYILKNQYEKLLDIFFEEIIITIGQNTFSVKKTDVLKYITNDDNFPIRTLNNFMDYVENSKINTQDLYYNNIKKDTVIHDFLKQYRYRSSDMKKIISLLRSYDEIIENKIPLSGNIENVNKLKHEIDSLNLDILYLPTYRRIEKDLYFNTKKSDDMYEDEFIHSGMDDVERLLYTTEEKIKTQFMQNYNKITLNLLEQYVNNNYTDEVVDCGKIRVTLNRLDGIINPKLKNKVIKTIENQSYRTNKEFSNLLHSLMCIYNEQNIYETNIEKFVEVSNKYLYNKKFEYNKNTIKTILYSTDKKILPLSQLSSGEKQIISIFASLYLDQTSVSNITIIDEPEISLSIKWQKMLLPDIISTNKCKLRFFDESGVNAVSVI